jgi:Rnl2 family RNA ligase
MSARGAGTTGGTWIATEKIHGANFVVGVTADGVWFGKRKAWLAPAEPFLGWQLIASELAGAAREVFRRLDRPQVVLYGELFGGAYPHPEVPAAPGLQPVQTGVWYAPDLRWAPFDVLVAADDHDDGELLPFSEVEELVASAGLLTPPVVGRGRLADLEMLPVRAATRVPAALGLPALDENVGEGLVLKQDVRAAPADRPIVKRKIAEMDESRFDESVAWQPGDVGAGALEVWAARLVNPARVASARSKVGADPRQIADEVVLDVMVDLESAFPEAWRVLDEAALDKVAAIVRACHTRISEA